MPRTPSFTIENSGINLSLIVDTVAACSQAKFHLARSREKFAAADFIRSFVLLASYSAKGHTLGIFLRVRRGLREIIIVITNNAEQYGAKIS